MKGENTMNKPENLYLVSSHGGSTLHIWASSSAQAKRIYCREKGISPSDYWCGMSTLTARKLKPKEIQAWEEEKRTLLFVKGMMDITIEANQK